MITWRVTIERTSPTKPHDDLVRVAREGLYCEAGGFHIDPWGVVDRAIVTHAHADHARSGSNAYLSSEAGAGVLRARIGPASIEGLAYGEVIDLNGVRVSMHPAGHVLGSAQVRIEHRGRIWVVTGDYKVEPDSTCRPFEPLKCHVLITESTFGLPIYRWRPQSEVFQQINDWWRGNQAQGKTSVILAYALGKAQRVLAGVDASIGPIGVHGAVARMNECYAAARIRLPTVVHATHEPELVRGAGLVLAPPSAAGSGSIWLRKLSGREGVSLGYLSGWMQVRGGRRRQSVDRGFVLSDHADWGGLLSTIRYSGAERIGVTHGYIEPLARWVREKMSLDAFAVPTRFEGERLEESEGRTADADGDTGPARAPEAEPS